MKPSVKASLYAFAIFFVIFLSLWLIIHHLLKDISPPYVGAMSAAISTVLTPQKKVIQKQTLEDVQLKWIFSKKVISIK